MEKSVAPELLEGGLIGVLEEIAVVDEEVFGGVEDGGETKEVIAGEDDAGDEECGFGRIKLVWDKFAGFVIVVEFCKVVGVEVFTVVFSVFTLLSFDSRS